MNRKSYKERNCHAKYYSCGSIQKLPVCSSACTITLYVPGALIGTSNVSVRIFFYEAGTYESMTLNERIAFLDGIHTNNIPLFDEDGDDMETADDYYSIRDDFLNHPEQFSLNDIPAFLEMLDDSCYQPSFMEIHCISPRFLNIHHVTRFFGMP